jgi:DDE superfamily endonuclease
LRYHRTTGLTAAQTQELVCRVNAELGTPWRKRPGRPKSLGLYRAVEAACAYLRQNATQEVIGEMLGASQPTVSRYLAILIPVISAVLKEFVPSADDAAEAVRGRGCLVDGTIAPCWSYRGRKELRSRKRSTTGFNVQFVTLLDGTPVYISRPLPGSTNDYAAFHETPVAQIIGNSGGAIGDKGYYGAGIVTPRKKPYHGEPSVRDKECNQEICTLRAPVERAIAHLKSWRVLHTDYRRPYGTYHDAYNAVLGLFFYSYADGFE